MAPPAWPIAAVVVNTLRGNGPRPTPQRLLVASAVAGAAGPLTAADVAASVQQDSPMVMRTTLYDTLALLHRMGLVQRAANGSVQRFAWSAPSD